MPELLLGKTTAEIITYLSQDQNIINLTLASYEPVEADAYNNHFIDEVYAISSHEIRFPGWVDRVRKNEALSLFPGKLGFKYPYPCIGSLLDTTEGKRHIPMLDFDSSTENPDQRNVQSEIRALKKTLKELCYPYGVILDSGEGLHYLGLRFLNEDGFGLLTKRVCKDMYHSRRAGQVDQLWVDACLYLGMFVLRLEAVGIKPKTPIVVDFFRPQYSPQERAVLVDEWRPLLPEERIDLSSFKYHLLKVVDCCPYLSNQITYLLSSGLTLSGLPFHPNPIGRYLLRVAQPVEPDGRERNIGIFPMSNIESRGIEIPDCSEFDPIASDLSHEEGQRVWRKIMAELPLDKIILA